MILSNLIWVLLEAVLNAIISVDRRLDRRQYPHLFEGFNHLDSANHSFDLHVGEQRVLEAWRAADAHDVDA